MLASRLDVLLQPTKRVGVNSRPGFCFPEAELSSGVDGRLKSGPRFAGCPLVPVSARTVGCESGTTESNLEDCAKAELRPLAKVK